MHKNSLSLLLLLVGLSCQISMVGNTFQINTKFYINDGTIKASTININTETISGSGVIEGKKITITCDKFDFQGSIVCTEECNIYAKETFDPDKVKCSGGGKFTAYISNLNAQ